MSAENISGTGSCLDEVQLELLFHSLDDELLGNRRQTLGCRRGRNLRGLHGFEECRELFERKRVCFGLRL